MGTSYLDRLEGGYELLRIRKFKAWTAALLIFVTFGVSALALAVGGASPAPLYMPIGSFLPVVLVFLLIGMVLWMFYRSLEVRYLKKESQKFLLAKNTMRRSLWTAVLCVVIAAALFLPGMQSSVNSSLTGSPVSQSLPFNAERDVSFDASDPLGVVRVPAVVVAVLTAGRSMTVYLDWPDGHRDPPYVVTATSGPLRISLGDGALGRFRITFHNSEPVSIEYSYLLEKAALPELFLFVPATAVVFAIASIGYYVYMRPKRERYEKAAIYSAEFQTRVDDGERLYTEYALSSDRPRPAVPSRGNGRAPFAARPAPETPPVPTASEPLAPVVPMPVVSAPLPAAVTVVEPPPPPPQTDGLFSEGAALFTQGQYRAAVDKFDEVLKLDPRATRALLAKGNAFLRLGEADEALEAFDAVLLHDRGNLDALLGTAGVYHAQHRWRDVVDLADTYLAIRAGDPEMLTYRGDAQLALGRRADAQISYEAALVKKPGNPILLQKIESTKLDVATLQSRALIASASGNLEQAVTLFDEVLRIEPDNANALTGKAVALKRGGRVDEALACLGKALASKPDHGGALLNQGRILEERGDLDEALEAYDKLIALNPEDADAWVAQGDVLGKMGRQADAIKSYNEALKASPGDEDTKAKIRDLEKSKETEGELLQELFQIRGIGPAKARAFRDAGFRSREDFKKATEEDLAKVHGVSRKLAADIVKHFQPGPPA